jgi:hypothetical protein
MKKSLSDFLRSGVLAATAALLLAAPAHAAACGNYQPGMLAFMTGTRPAPCPYQGDYMVKQGPTYGGPAVVAPQPTYAPTPTAADYPYVSSQKSGSALAAETGPARKRVVRSATVKRVAVKSTAAKHAAVKRAAGKRPVVNVKNELPPRKGKVQIVQARAEVRIYSPDRMDIRLYRR